jgi:hypothetical protein
MQSDAIANDLSFVEYDPALINADHGPQLVVQELLPAAFDILGEPNPVAAREHDLLPTAQRKKYWRDHIQELKVARQECLTASIIKKR